MSERITATDARVRFGELLRRVAEERAAYVVERSGRPTAVVLSIEEYERLLAAARGEGWRAALERALAVGDEIAAKRGEVPLRSPVDVIREGREEKDGRLLDLR